LAAGPAALLNFNTAVYVLEVLGKLNFNCLWSAKIGSQRRFGALFGLLGLLGIQYLSDHSFLLCDSDNNTKIQPKTLPKA